MAKLSRAQFVQLCTQAILDTREQVSICNQFSGYQKYHREIKENGYFEANVREPIMNTKPRDFMYRHGLLRHTGLGNCHELADFLLVEIGKKITENHAVAKIRIVVSERADHVYLEIKVRLVGELGYSTWEVDAWDPRIIDISTRPDGSVKNRESLDYGYATSLEQSVDTDEIDYRERHTFFRGIRKPAPGAPCRHATPEREMLDKHPHLYSDHTIDRAVEQGKLDPSGELQYLQKRSIWQ